MRKSKMWQEFKAFAFKGNMIDLAVAVVIGAAFGTVINSLVSDIIMPSIFYVTSSVHSVVDKTAEVVQKAANPEPATQPTTEPTTKPAVAVVAPPPPPPAPAAAPAPAPDQKPVNIDWRIGNIKIGSFIGALLNFIIIAFAVFIMIVKLLGSVMKRAGGTPDASEPTTKECPYCLSVIPIRATKCSHCTSDQPNLPDVPQASTPVT